MSKKFLSGINVTGTATLNTVANAGLDTDKFLVLDAAGNVDFRTGAELKVDIGADVVSRVEHEVKLGETMTIGTPVYVGVDLNAGTNMTVYKATNATEAGSSKTLGLIASSGITNDLVEVVTEGLLAGLNTSAATKGDPVWLGVDGALLFGLANKPVAPAHMVFLGIVTRVQSNNGEIFVKVQNGFEMNEIHNYLQGSVQNNEVIVYESATSLYKPKTIPTILGYTPVPDSRTITINGTTYDLSANRSWTVSANQNARTEYEFTTDGTTATYTATYSIGQVDVFYNGSKLSSTEFTATNGTSITLGFTPPSGQLVEVVAWETGGGVSSGRTLTINGVTYDLSANRSWTIAGGVSSFNTRTGDITLISSDVTTALGYTPYNSTNPSGYITSSALSAYLPLTGGTVSSTPSSTTGNVLIVKNNNTTDNGFASATIALDTSASNTMADIRLASTTPVGIRIYASNATLTGTPAGAGFQMFSNTSSLFPGQVYFDSGAHNSAALIFRTATSGGTITERFRISATGAATFAGSLSGTSGTFSGTVSANTLSFTNGTYTGNIKFGGLDASAYAFDLVYQTNNALRFGVSGGDGPQFQGWGGTAPAFAGQMYFDFGSYTRNIAGRALYFRSMTTGAAPTVLTIAANGDATFVGSINGTSAAFSGAISGTTGSFNGSVRAVNLFNLYKSDNTTLGGQLAYDSSINQLYLWNNVSNGYFSIYVNFSEALKIISSGAATFLNTVSSRGYLANDSGTIGTPIDTGGTKAYFDASGINGAALTVRADSVGRTIRMTSDGGGTVVGAIDINSSGLNIGTNTSHPIIFKPQATEAMRITTGRAVGIRSTNPEQPLHVNQGITDFNQGIPGTSGTTQNGILRLTPAQNTFGECLDFGMNVATTYAWIQATNTGNLAVNYNIVLNPNGGNIAIGSISSSVYRLNVSGSLRSNRSVYNWHNSAWQGNSTYWHMKTNLWAGGSPNGNSQYTMSYFKGYSYSYNGSILEGSIGFHNWDGYLYSVKTIGTLFANAYVSSDGYVVLVVQSGYQETGITIDWHQHWDYTFREAVVTAAGLHGTTTGKY